jgi:hypothetical protein
MLIEAPVRTTPERRTVVTVLEEARDLIANERYWTTGAFARDRLGMKVSPRNESASQWCAIGALERVQICWPPSPIDHYAARILYRARPRPYVVTEVNDRLGHEAVLAMYDRAIALAREELC